MSFMVILTVLLLIIITEKLLHSAKLAYTKYKQHLEEEKKLEDRRKQKLIEAKQRVAVEEQKKPEEKSERITLKEHGQIAQRSG